MHVRFHSGPVVRRLTLALAVCTTLLGASARAEITIENETLRVTVDNNGGFTVLSIASGKTVIADGKLAVAGGNRTTKELVDGPLGKGQSIEVSGENGASGRVSLYPKLPFALLEIRIDNTTNTKEAIFNKVSVATFSVDLGKPASQLKTMGTGGLADGTKPEGSYVWLAAADPKTRNGVVAAWLTHDRASGVLLPKPEGDKLTIEARADYGRLRILPGKSAESETLAIGYFDDARLGLEQWADAVAKQYHIKLRPQPLGYCTWYAEKHGGSADEKSLVELTDFADKNLKPWGFGFVQIDDHWQLGFKQNSPSSPKKNFTAADPKGPFPAGMKGTADYIKSKGLMPGIWFIPFSGTQADPFFADKQDLFVRDDKGRIYDSTWGGHPLDMTNPKAQAYLRGIVDRIAKDWGYTYFKMDGLYTGLAVRQNYVNDAYKEEKYENGPSSFGDAVFFNPDMTNVEAYRTGMKIIREAAGPDVFFLGCNMAQNMRMFGASIGVFDAMRVGPDNKGNWDGWKRSPFAGSREYFLNGRIWYNDPDPLYVRSAISTEDARTIVSWHAVSGALASLSDWLPDLPAERIDMLRRLMPSHGKTARPVDYFENDPPRVWIVSDETKESQRYVVGLFNWGESEQSFDVPLSRFGLTDKAGYTAFDFWGNKFVSLDGSVKASVPKHGCLVLAIRPKSDHPQVVSTSRHITQGMVDLSEEKWDAAKKTLSGKSQVVADDPYELRIALPAGSTLKATGITLSAPGTKTDLKQNADGVRATINPTGTSAVLWTVNFQ